MPTFRQLVTSNPGSAWMRGQNQQQQLTAARNQFPTTVGQVGYGGSMSSPTANQTANAGRAYSLGMPNATSYLPSYQQLATPFSGGDAQALMDRQSAIRAYMEMTPGLNQGLPEFSGQRDALMAERNSLQSQLDNTRRAQWADNQARINARAEDQRRASDQAKQWYASQGRYQQSTPQSMIGRADQAAAARYMPEGGGQAAQWGWDGGTGTWQPGNASARAATFGALRAPSPAYVASRQAEQQAYQIPAQQAARTQQLIYGYGGW